jgi:DNA-binding response OmpR family regulator
MPGEQLKQGRIALSPLVYLVDDDEDFREEIVLGLSRLGANVHGFPDATTFYRAYAAKPADIIILDIGLEGEDGLSIAGHLRASRSVGIVIVTGKGAVEDRVHGLEKGADAYLVKPIDIRELAATLLSLNERLHRQSAPSQPQTPQWALVEGGWVLTDGLDHRLRLTASEQRFLERLFLERGKTVERRALVEALGADVYDFNYAHLDTIASRLRRRAGKCDMALPLHAVRGQGFAFAE